MAENYKSINKVAFATIAGTLGVQFVNFLLIPILTHALGTSGFGIVSLYTVWCSLSVSICGLQTSQSIIYIIQEKSVDLRKIYYANMLTCSLISFFIFTIISFVLYYVLRKSLEVSSILILFVFIQSFGNYCVNYVNTIYTQEQTPLKQVFLSLFISITTAVLSIILVFNIDDYDEKYWGRIIGYALPYFICGIAITSFYVFPFVKQIRFKYIKEYLPICLPIILHSIAGMIFSQSDRVMLGYIKGTSEVGLYSFAFSIASLLSVVWVTINNFFQPFFFSYMKKYDYKLLDEKVNNICILYTCIYLIFLFLAPILMPMYGGKEFEDSVTYLPVLILGVYFNFLYMFNSNYEIYYKKTGMIARATIFSACLNVILNFILIPKFSIMGASLATLVSNIGLFLLHFYSAMQISVTKKVKYVFKIKKILLYAFFVILVTFLSYFLREYIFFQIFSSLIIGLYILVIMIKRKSII